MSDHTIVVRELTKIYRKGESTGPALLGHALLRAVRRQRIPSQSFLALDRVSFSVRAGTALGIVGRNGAGKSTLLKLLSRITKPSSGTASLRGRVGSLLEVGTGFHPELTGRENISMNAAMLGMRRADIARKFDEIVGFAEVEEFIDTPVKRYSTGMYVRLAFSVAAHLEPDILLVDEVLAVGDVGFQRKCLGKMSEVTTEGRTVLFVSHNTAAVQQFTTECVLLNAGRVVAHGKTQDVMAGYLSLMGEDFREVDVTSLVRAEPQLGSKVRITRVALHGDKNGSFAADGPAFEVAVDIRRIVPAIRFALSVYKFDGTPVGIACGIETVFPGVGRHTYVADARTSLLAPGRYFLGISVGIGDLIQGFVNFDALHETVHFEISGYENDDGTTAPWHTSWGPIRFPEPMVDRVSNS